MQPPHRGHFLAAVESWQGSRQRTNFQARWITQSCRVGAVYWDAYQWISRNGYHGDTDEMMRRQPLHIVYRHLVQTSSCHTHRLTL